MSRNAVIAIGLVAVLAILAGLALYGRRRQRAGRLAAAREGISTIPPLVDEPAPAPAPADVAAEDLGATGGA